MSTRTHYLDDKVISKIIFLGKAVPSANTVLREENEGYKYLVDITIGGFCKAPKGVIMDDPYGVLERIAISLYRQIIANKDPVISEEDQKILMDDYMYNGPALLVAETTPYNG